MVVLSSDAMLPGMLTTPKVPKIDDAGVGFRLDALREAAGLDKGSFATTCGIDPSSYSKIIQGEKPLRSGMAFACSERWGVTMDYLYRGSLEKLPSQYASKIIEILTARQR